MSYKGLSSFIETLEKQGDLLRIKPFVDPVLEITEVTERISKNQGKALLFENTGTKFPLLINAFGSEKRISLALSRTSLSKTADEIKEILDILITTPGTTRAKISAFPRLFKLSGILPTRSRRKGRCQEIIATNPDLSVLPVLKCWPFDGGRFITLPVVHTFHPETGATNAGMYRMQILDSKTTAMHWQRHKTGANHFDAWKKLNRIMPVSVTLGGDPVYTYAATAPLPENISEYILAGFLRNKSVKLVKCITNDIYVPEDADIVIEGYVDPSEDLVLEGPFGDHTGFYSLADFYPKFHVTCISHSNDAVYPATIVGIPPQEDAWLTEATEKIFLAPIKLTLIPEIEDFHMPAAGVAHNLLIVKIRKTYPGQGMKVINSLFGAGQIMFTKYLIVVSGNINIRNYYEVIAHVSENTDLESDIVFTKGPLDVLDHSSEKFSFGGKMGIDATVKHQEEKNDSIPNKFILNGISVSEIAGWLSVDFIRNYNLELYRKGIKVLIIGVNPSTDQAYLKKTANLFRKHDSLGCFKLVLAVDHTVDVNDIFLVAWQVLGNSDPFRDHIKISPFTLLIDGTIKFYRKRGFPRPWPNIVCSDMETIRKIDNKWNSLGFEYFIPSPSQKYLKLIREGEDKIVK